MKTLGALLILLLLGACTTRPTRMPKMPFGAEGLPPPSPDATTPPGGHWVVYDADQPTAQMGSAELRRAFTEENIGTVIFHCAGHKQPIVGQVRPYTTARRSSDGRFYFIFPDAAPLPTLTTGDQILISGYEEAMPRVYRLNRMPAGYYDMGFSLVLKTPHRFLSSSFPEAVDSVSIHDFNITNISNQGCVMTMPEALPTGDYAVLVTFGSDGMTPVFYDFSVR